MNNFKNKKRKKVIMLSKIIFFFKKIKLLNEEIRDIFGYNFLKMFYVLKKKDNKKNMFGAYLSFIMKIQRI